MSADEWFEDFGGQSARAGGNFFQPGTYLVRLKALHRRTSTRPQTKGHKLLIAELMVERVLVSYAADPGIHPGGETNPDSTPKGHPKGGWGASNAPGESISWVQNPTKHGDTAYSNIKGLLLACTQVQVPGAKEGDFTPDQWRQALLRASEPPGTALGGLVLKAVAGKTRLQNGSPFTPVTFEPVPQDILTQAA